MQLVSDNAFPDSTLALISRVKETASNVTICHAQIDIVHDRCMLLLEAILTASTTMLPEKLESIVSSAEALFKKIHAKLVQAAIYGRAKAFVKRQEFYASLESFNCEIDLCTTAILESASEELFDWQENFIQARGFDEIDALNSLGSILDNPVQSLVIQTLGQPAIDNVEEAIAMGLNLDQAKFGEFRFAFDRILDSWRRFS